MLPLTGQAGSPAGASHDDAPPPLRGPIEDVSPTISTAYPAATSASTQLSTARPTRSPVQTWLQAWWTVALRGPGIISAALAAALFFTGLAGVFSIPAAGVGVVIIALCAWGAWLLGKGQRHLLLAFTGTDIGPPPPGTTVAWRRLLGLDRPRLLALGWTGLHFMWALLAGALVLGLAAQAIALVSVPLVARWAPEGGVSVWFTSVDSLVGQLLVALIGVMIVIALPLLSKALANVDIALGRWLLGQDPQQALARMSERVQTLTTTREETIDSVEAERRRIERDLHDGPQQRLVSVAMTLGLARTQLDSDPEAARALLEEAHASSKEAITEMRQVARGIVPPILADRGLDAAVSAIASRSPIPVTVTSRLPFRLEPTIEAIAYFCISESLTNIAKHARATSASVDLGVARAINGDRLAITVTDDGAGGAVVGAGSGLTGLRQRIASVDGELYVHSPVGGGTTVAITLPLRPRSAS